MLWDCLGCISNDDAVWYRTGVSGLLNGSAMCATAEGLRYDAVRKSGGPEDNEGDGRRSQQHAKRSTIAWIADSG